MTPLEKELFVQLEELKAEKIELSHKAHEAMHSLQITERALFEVLNSIEKMGIDPKVDGCRGKQMSAVATMHRYNEKPHRMAEWIGHQFDVSKKLFDELPTWLKESYTFS